MLHMLLTNRSLRHVTVLMCLGALASCSFASSGSPDALRNADAVVSDGGVGDGAAGDGGTRVDAAGMDAPAPPTPFDVELCPTTYKTVGTVTTSRYRAAVQNIAISWNAAAQACEADSPELQQRTHLVVFESLTEYNAVVPTLQTEHNFNYSWTGSFRYIDNLVPRFGTVTGQTAGILDPLKYDLTARQDVLETTRATFLLGTDYRYSNNPLGYSYNYICECDGRAGGQRPQ